MNISRIVTPFTILILSLTVMIGWPLFRTAAQSLSTSGVIEQRTTLLKNSTAHPDDQPPIVFHSFSNDQLSRQNDIGASFIIHHGRPVELGNYRIIYSHSETLPIYVTEEVGIDDLSAPQTKDILEGRVKRWSEVSGSNVPIHLYGPSSDNKKKALAFQINQAGIDLQAQILDSGNYDDLRAQLENDPGALVLGLRSAAAQPRNLGSAKGFEPKLESGSLLFDVPIYLYIRKDNPEAQTAARACLTDIKERATEDNKDYPLNDRLAELSRNR